MSAVLKAKPVAVKPMKHQLVSLKHSEKSTLVLDTSDPGTGKTMVRILAFAKRRAKGGGCMLVLAPRSLLETAWDDDIRKFAPHLKTSIAWASNREEAFAANADVYITNHDAVNWLAKKPKSFFTKFSEVVIDESTAFKHHSSNRSKAVSKILHQLGRSSFVYRAALTATPTSNGITDIWHQVHLLDGGKRLGPSFYGFRNTVCVPTQVGKSAHALRWDDREGAEDAVFGLLKDITIRHKFEDCVDIPANLVYTMMYTMPPGAKAAYDTLAEKQLLLLGTDRMKTRLTGKPAKITAINAAAVSTKLLQLASGAVYTESGKYTTADYGRYQLIIDLVLARKHSFVLFQWNHQRDELVAAAEKAGITYCVYDGETSDKDRAEMVRAYQNGMYRVMFAHPKTAGHGLTLTRGTTTIWASPTYDLEHWAQAGRRQYRIGQTQKTETIVILAKGTIDEHIYNEILMPKDGRMKSLLELFASNYPTKGTR